MSNSNESVELAKMAKLLSDACQLLSATYNRATGEQVGKVNPVITPLNNNAGSGNNIDWKAMGNKAGARTVSDTSAAAEEQQSSKRSKGGKRSKAKSGEEKQLYIIQDISRMPAINEEKLKEVLSAKPSVIPENFDWSVMLNEKKEGRPASPSTKSPAVLLCTEILNKHLDLISPEVLELIQSTPERQPNYWFRLSVLSLVVSIIRQLVWANEPYDPQDLKITPADIPAELEKKAIKTEGESKKVVKKVKPGYTIRSSPHSTFSFWKTLLNEDAETANLLCQYELGSQSKIFSAKWKAGKDNKFNLPEDYAHVSAKTHSFLEKLLVAEQWNHHRELYLYAIESREAKNEKANE